MNRNPTRRGVLLALASAAALPGCLWTPPVRPQRALRGRNPVDPEIIGEVDRIGGVFRAALQRAFRAPPEEQAAWVGALPPRDQSVAWEATAMAVAWLERNTGSPQTWEGLCVAQGPEHELGLALGLGWALSWLELPAQGLIEDLDPLLRWRVLDGYGFRDGLVSPRPFALRQDPPALIDGYARTIWRQGLGRSLWYTTHGDLDELGAILAAFPASERADLWRGIGVAATWIGSLDEVSMNLLQEAAGAERSWLALGSAMAARTCRDIGGVTERQTAPCSVLGGASPEALAAVTDAAEAALPATEGELPLFQQWMNGIASRLV